MSDKKCVAEKKTEMEGVITQVCLTDAITSYYKLNLVCKRSIQCKMDHTH